MPQSKLVNKEQLLQALESCQPGLAQREIVEQSTCFIFQKGFIRTFNDETACRCPSPMDRNFQGAVQAEPLLELLRKIPDEEITIDEGEGELLVHGRKRDAGIRMEKNILLPLEVVEKPSADQWKELNQDFGDAVGLVHQCAGKDESKFTLTCVHVTPRWVEATDFFQLCRWKMKTGFAEPALMRHSAIQHVAALGAREFAETPSWVHFRSPHGLILSCRRYTDVADFPDLSQYLDIEGKELSLPKILTEVVDLAQIFVSEEGDYSDYVAIELRPWKKGKGFLKLRGQGPQGWYQETRTVKYSGDPLSFLAPPALLVDLVKRHSECIVTTDYLKATSGKYAFVACLARPTDNPFTANSSNTSDESEDE